MQRGYSFVRSSQQCRPKRFPHGILAAGLTGLLLLTLAAAGPAQADELDDRKQALEQEIADVQESLEFLDSDIVKTVTQLKEYQHELPAAQEALSEAQGRVEEAAGQVAALSQRVDLALQTKDKINQQMADDEARLADTRKLIGQIATQAYKQGGVPSNLQLFFGSGPKAGLADTISLADQALRTQNAALDRLSQQNATNVNSEARLAAVEEEIRGLKEQAEAALAAEQVARDAAAAEKDKVDRLIADTSALSDKLQARKPEIQQKLAAAESAHAQVQADIAERQEQLRREAEERRKREEAKRKAQQAAWEKEQRRIKAAQAAAAAKGQPVPQIVPTVSQPAPPASQPSSFGLMAPVSAYVSSGFGWRPTPAGTIDFNGTGGYMHTGLDYAAGCGTPVRAPAAGTVWRAAFDTYGAGNFVILDHGVVGGNALMTKFFHLTRSVVYPGQQVSQGQLIGYSGTTGNSTGCHLHFETVLNGTLVNPAGLL